MIQEPDETQMHHSDFKNWETIPRLRLLIYDITRESYVIVKLKCLKIYFHFYFQISAGYFHVLGPIIFKISCLEYRCERHLFFLLPSL